MLSVLQRASYALLFAAKIDRHDVGAVVGAALPIGLIILWIFGFGRLHPLHRGLELEAEIHRRVHKLGYRCIGNDELCGNLIEAEAYAELVLFDTKVPKLVLQYDRHFIGKPLPQILGDRDARRLSLESNVEVVIAGKTSSAFFNFAQDAADYGAQSFLYEIVGIRLSGVSSLISLTKVRGRTAIVKARLILSMTCKPWSIAYSRAMRTAKIERKTAETAIAIELNLDGTGQYAISTGLAFLTIWSSNLPSIR